MSWAEERVTDPRERRRYAAVGLLGVLLVVGALGAWWFATADDRTSDANRWIVFSQQGGIVGLTDRLIIEEDGTAQLRRREGEDPVEFSVPGELMEDVRSALERVDWDEASALHATPPGADLIYYTLQHEGWFATGIGFTREEHTLQPLLRALRQVIDSRPG